MDLRPQGSGTPLRSLSCQCEGIALPPGGPFTASGVIPASGRVRPRRPARRPPRAVGIPRDPVGHPGSVGPCPTAPARCSSISTAPCCAPPADRSSRRPWWPRGSSRRGSISRATSLMYAFYNRFGESAAFIGLARAAARVMRNRSADATRRAGKRAVARPASTWSSPGRSRRSPSTGAEGRRWCWPPPPPTTWSTRWPAALGFDAIIATRYEESRRASTPAAWIGGFVWGTGKRRAAKRWAEEHGIDLAASHVYSDSLFDLPLLSAVGHPHPLNADPRLAAGGHGPPVAPRALGPAPGDPLAPRASSPTTWPGPSSAPRRSRTPASTQRGWSTSRTSGPVLLAANHRSYFDVAAIGVVAARLDRPVRFMAKRELFDAPVVGQLARALGGIMVDRESRTSEPDAAGRRRPARRRAGDRAAPGDHPRGGGLLRPRPGRARPAPPAWPPRRAPPSSRSGCGGPSEVWPRNAEGPERDQPAPPADGHRDGRRAARGRRRRRGGRHRNGSWPRSPTSSPRRRG